MTIVRMPKRELGHESQQLSAQEARRVVDDKFQQGWVAAIDGEVIRNTKNIQEDSEVSLYPPIAGGA